VTSNAYLFDKTCHGPASETVPVKRGPEAGRAGLRGVRGRLIHSRQKLFTSMRYLATLAGREGFE
jgi:hypothetical protein